MKFPEEKKSSFQKCPAGTHVATCYEVIDLGTQEVTYNDETKHQRKIWLGWEVPGERMEDGRPFVIGKRYTLSSFKKANLRQDLESWRGVPFQDEDFGPEGKFDIRNVIGVGCLLSVVHEESGGNTYANIKAVSALPKGTSAESLVNEATYVSLEPGAFDWSAFERLSERMQDIIMKSPEYEAILVSQNQGGEVVQQEETADVPF